MRTFALRCIWTFVLAACLVACGGKRSNNEKGGTYNIAVIPKGTTNEYWKAIHAGASKAGRELRVEVLWHGPMREDDREEQVKVVEDFISRRVDGIVLAPLDEKAMVSSVRDAVQQRIPVVILDSAIRWDGYVSFVATDNYQGGALAADRLGQTLKEGKVVLMRYLEGSASTTMREAGFLDTLRKKYAQIALISSNQRGGATTETAYATAENLLANFPDIDGIFCPNESTTMGMLRAIQDAGRASSIRFVGFDSSVPLVKALARGELDSLVLQDPYRMGELGVRTLVNYLHGKHVERRIDTGVTLATRDTMDTEPVKALLSPNLE